MNEIIFIIGPTATGKTDVVFDLAKKLHAEIISCDSMVVYKEANIITSKPASEMLSQVLHHFVNIISVTEEYSVFDYCTKASALMNDLYQQKKPVVVCGGSGLYVRALLDGIFEGGDKDELIRNRLMAKMALHGNVALHKELEKIDAQAAKKISVNDTKRIVRALEVYYSSGMTISEKRKDTKGLYEKLPIKIFGLTCERKILYERINNRVDKMVKEGAVEEVKALFKFPLSQTAGKIIGIKEIGGFIKGEYDIEKAKVEMKLNTRHFAKRQVTWFKPDKRISWLNIEGLTTEQLSELILRS